MKQLEKNIGYHFRDKSLLKTAVTHSSYANENRGGLAYNERLEFLGDAVLQLITSEKLFKENPDMPEGRMSKQRAALVCEDALAGYSHEISLGDFMLLGKGEEATGGRNRPSILADAFEALIGAIFLAFIAIFPMIVNAISKGALSGLAFGGSSLLIVVGVALETAREIEAQMTMRHYKGFLQ